MPMTKATAAQALTALQADLSGEIDAKRELLSAVGLAIKALGAKGTTAKTEKAAPKEEPEAPQDDAADKAKLLDKIRLMGLAFGTDYGDEAKASALQLVKDTIPTGKAKDGDIAQLTALVKQFKALKVSLDEAGSGEEDEEDAFS